MRPEILGKFKKLFEDQKLGLLHSYKRTNEDFNLKSDDLSDEIDLASAALEQNMHMRLRSRETLFVRKIDEALLKIQAGTFGVCECCDENIEMSRLEVRPTATLCLNCKEVEEMRESQSADGRKSKASVLKVT